MYNLVNEINFCNTVDFAFKKTPGLEHYSVDQIIRLDHYSVEMVFG